MADFNMSGKVQTVLGPIEPDELGVTLTHEHLLIDISVLYSAQDTASGKDVSRM